MVLEEKEEEKNKKKKRIDSSGTEEGNENHADRFDTISNGSKRSVNAEGGTRTPTPFRGTRS